MKKLFRGLGKGSKRKESLEGECYGVHAQDQPHYQIGSFKHHQFSSNCHNIFHRLSRVFPDRVGSVHDMAYECELPSGGFCESFDVENKQGMNSRGERCGEEQKAYLPDDGRRFKKSMYVISISNSQNFHIGSQSTINVTGDQPLGDSGRDLKQTFNSNSSVELGMNWEKLLDWEEKLNEEHIALISVHMDKRWKNFGRSLGLEQTCLEEDFKNGSDRTLTVYDLLTNYLKQFPNTSLGFIINALSLIDHHELIKKLTEFFPGSSLHLQSAAYC